MQRKELLKKVNSSVQDAIPNVMDLLIQSKVCLSKSIILSKIKSLRLMTIYSYSAKTTLMFMLCATAANIENFFARIALMKVTLITSTPVTNLISKALKTFSHKICPNYSL
jgi:hypothetical protein